MIFLSRGQAVFPGSLTGTFVLHSLQSVISELASYKIGLFWLVSIAE